MTAGVIDIRAGLAAGQVNAKDTELAHIMAEALAALEAQIAQTQADNDPMAGHFAALYLAVKAQKAVLEAMTARQLIDDAQFRMLRFDTTRALGDALRSWKIEFFAALRLRTGLWLALIIVLAGFVGGFTVTLMGF